MKLNLSIVLISSAILAACGESIPTKHSALSHAKGAAESVAMPIIVGAGESNVSLAGAEAIDNGDGAVTVTTDSTAFDSVATRTNAQIKSGLGSRAVSAPTVTPAATDPPPLQRWIGYRAGAVAGYTDFTYDAAGLRIKRVRYTDPGADGQWFTADDTVSGYALFGVTKGTIQTTVIAFGGYAVGAGVGALTGAGPDGIWFNADDLVQHYSAELTDPATRAISDATYLRAGLDGTWFTTDDVIRYSSKEGLNAQGDQEWTQYRNAGLDANWATLADNRVGHFEIESMTAGVVNRHVFYIGPGLDGLQYTADDRVGYYHDFTRDAQGKLTAAVLFINSGLDTQWFTSDDTVGGCRVVDRNAAGDPTLSKRYTPGVDGQCFTADDVMIGYKDLTYDPTGTLANSKEYRGAGVDGQWFTADDDLDEEYVY